MSDKTSCCIFGSLFATLGEEFTIAQSTGQEATAQAVRRIAYALFSQGLGLDFAWSDMQADEELVQFGLAREVVVKEYGDEWVEYEYGPESESE